MQGKLTNVDQTSNKIEIELPDQSVELLAFDVLVLATGTTYTQPWRGQHDQIVDSEVRQADWKKVRDDVSAANSVLCVGAGPTGLESAGWIKDNYPNKTVGVALRGRAILATINGAHSVAEGILKNMKIDVHYGTTY